MDSTSAGLTSRLITTARMRMRSPTVVALVCLGLVHGSVHPRPTVLPRASTLRVTSPSSSRRAILAAAAAAAAATCAAPPAAHAAVGQAKEVLLTTSASGLKWGDIRPGVGNVPGPGQTVTIDYMMTKRAGAYADTCVPGPSYCTHGPRAPEKQGSLLASGSAA